METERLVLTGGGGGRVQTHSSVLMNLCWLSGLGMVMHTRNPSYLGGQGRNIISLKQTRALEQVFASE